MYRRKAVTTGVAGVAMAVAASVYAVHAGGAEGLQTPLIKTFEGTFVADEEIPVGIRLAGPGQAGSLEVTKVRFQTGYDAWTCIGTVAWRGEQTSCWKVSVELMDRQGRVLYHPADDARTLVTAGADDADSVPCSAKVDLSHMACKGRLHAARLRLTLANEGVKERAGDPEQNSVLRAVDANDGQPLDHAVVLIDPWPQPDRPTLLYASGKGGKVQVRVPKSRSTDVFLEVQHGGHATVARAVPWLDDLAPEEQVSLPRATRIGGVVRDLDGHPVEGVSVGVRSFQQYDAVQHSLSQVVKTDRDGRWAADGVPQDVDRVDLAFSHPQYRTPDDSHLQVEGTGMAEARQMARVDRMVKGSVISGVVSDEQGRPIQDAGIHMAFELDSRSCTPVAHVLTDSAGRFQFGCGRPPWRGKTVLVVEVPGFVPAIREVLPGQEAAKMQIWVTRGRTLTGRVVDGEGQPVSDARVAVDPFADRPWYGVSLRPTDSQGRFSGDNLPERVLIGASKQGFMAVRYQPFPGESNEPVVRMRPAIHLTGKVVSASDRSPVGRFEVAICRPDQKQKAFEERWVTWHGYRAGRYDMRLDEPLESDRLLLVQADGYSPQATKLPPMDGGSRTFDFALTAEPSFRFVRSRSSPQKTILKGLVVDPNGVAAPGVSVSACISSRNEVFTAPDGTFRVVLDERRGDGKCSTVVVRDRRRNLAAVWEYLDPKSQARIQLEPAVRMVGKVQDAKGHGIPDAKVSLSFWDIDFFSHAEQIADAEGGFMIPAVPRDHTCVISAEAKGYGINRAEVEIPEGRGQVDVTAISLPVADQSLAGVVVDRGSNPVVGIDLAAHARLQPYVTATTDEKGRFSFTGLIAGRLTIQGHAYEPRKLFCDATVEAGDQNVRIVAVEVDENFRPVTPRQNTLVGKPLPDLTDLSKDLSNLQTSGRPVLLCLVDLDQRPSTRGLVDLSQKAGDLSAKGIDVVVVQTPQLDLKKYDDWLKTSKVDLPIRVADIDYETTRVKWCVQSLPWLILTDKGHKVKAEGFAVSGLDRVLSR